MHAPLNATPSSLKAPSIHPLKFSFSDDWVLWSDSNILVINKPSGLLSVAGRSPENQECLLTHLHPHYPSAKIVHRLDMDTSGIMVLALNPETHRHLSWQFETRQTKKPITPFALVCPVNRTDKYAYPCAATGSVVLAK
nr:pseudouridine synthase [Thiomicrorhabdus aquaedulcis]